ncbi:MAG: hypothetical protein AAFW97_12980 [Pseudomonadota bacterium]
MLLSKNPRLTFLLASAFAIGCSRDQASIFPESEFVQCDVVDKQAALVSAIEDYVEEQNSEIGFSKHPATDSGFPLQLRFADGHIHMLRVDHRGINVLRSSYTDGRELGTILRLETHYAAIVDITQSTCR